MYKFLETETRDKYEGRYWNCQGNGIAIVASITKGIDWAAYIGTDKSRSEGATLQFVSDWGCKLTERDARYFFPDITLPYRN